MSKLQSYRLSETGKSPYWTSSWPCFHFDPFIVVLPLFVIESNKRGAFFFLGLDNHHIEMTKGHRRQGKGLQVTWRCDTCKKLQWKDGWHWCRGWFQPWHSPGSDRRVGESPGRLFRYLHSSPSIWNVVRKVKAPIQAHAIYAVNTK